MKSTCVVNDSPIGNATKTNGGISKSLLTPCRRLGLTRNRKTPGPSPLTPINSNLTDKKSPIQKPPTQKKDILQNKDIKCAEITDESTLKLEVSSKTVPNNGHCDIELITTPIRSKDVVLPKKKHSKSLISALAKKNASTHINDSPNLEPTIIKNAASLNVKLQSVDSPSIYKDQSISNKKNGELIEHTKSIDLTPKQNNAEEKLTISPDELTKTCVVVIQKRLLKSSEKVKTIQIVDTIPPLISDRDVKILQENIPNKTQKVLSQNVSDSDSENEVLSKLSQKKNTNSFIQDTKLVPKKRPRTLILDEEDDDFCPYDQSNKVKKLENNAKKSSSSNIACQSKNIAKTKPTITVANLQKTPSESSYSTAPEDDDDFDYRKTILIRKSYNKVTKPLKAKSTGSITQKDIDDIKLRIAMKRNALLAKSGSKDIIELSMLIKKWRRGCQEALLELLEIMKMKVPEKQNMDIVELLKMLNIPATLVGYDTDDDNFLTPESII